MMAVAPIADCIRQVIHRQSEIKKRNSPDQAHERVMIYEQSIRVFDKESIRCVVKELQSLGVF